MEVVHSEEDGRGTFRIHEGETVLGSMVYVRSGPDVVIVQHTGVEEAGRGKGCGKLMFEALVEWARTTETRVVAQCKFVRSMFLKNPDTRDVMR